MNMPQPMLGRWPHHSPQVVDGWAVIRLRWRHRACWTARTTCHLECALASVGGKICQRRGWLCLRCWRTRHVSRGSASAGVSAARHFHSEL